MVDEPITVALAEDAAFEQRLGCPLSRVRSRMEQGDPGVGADGVEWHLAIQSDQAEWVSGALA